jgi:hypothetical protein
VKVGNCQALNTQTQGLNPLGFFMPENRVNRLVGELKFGKGITIPKNEECSYSLEG